MNRRRRKIILIQKKDPAPSGAVARFLAQAEIEPSAGPGWCLAWVCNVFEHAFGHVIRRETAYIDCLNTRTYYNTDIPAGAVVYGTGLNSGGAGHIGIYMGNGIVRDNQARGGVGVVVNSTFEEWCSWQTDTIMGRTGFLGWGWFNNENLQEM